ncbi:hypothetical protein HYALB_00001986 [Hymenoscyphus albidus]|uniref:DUF7704 domain-containing protein n=1 Tax=Hymenoscyphus albidus TaxID=595503 RepID=A0A9N9LD28_9HELO|nr:hypothetical protein HYALB_00001986 [Hymenoscyphus albidus]
MAPSKTPIGIRMSVIYTIYFLYFEAPMAALGTYLIAFDPIKFLQGTVPTAAMIFDETYKIEPLTMMMMTNIGALYLLFAIFEGAVLRVTKEKIVWKTVLAAMAVCDIGHLYAVYAIAPAHAFQVLAWNSYEWINYGTLVMGLLLRVSFLLGIGRN